MSDDHDAFALLVTGPAGAGKSAAAHAWAMEQPRPTAHIEVDAVREFITAGYADPQDGWTPETSRQYAIARQNCADMARRYIAEGINCIIDDAIFPLWEEVSHAGWSRDLRDTPHMMVVLAPRFAVVTERNLRRYGSRLLTPEMLRTIYDMMEPWRDQCRFPVIDTSELSIAQTAQAIQRMVERRQEQGNSR